MATLKSVPYPRWPEAPSGQIAADLSGAGFDPNLAQIIGSVLEAQFSRMADNNQANEEFITDESRITNASVENHDHDGVDDSQVDHGNLLGRGDDDHTQYLNEARHDADDHSGLIDTSSFVTSPFLLMGG